MSGPADIHRDLRSDLDLALAIADAADAVSLPFYERRTFTLSHKSDHSEVTEADRDTESTIVGRLRIERPDDGVFGEEHGHAGRQDSEFTWVVDPIDGTSNFVRGVPVWATLIALVHHELGPVVGVVSAPAMNRRWWAARGLGSFALGRRISVSDVSSIADSQLSVTFNSGWDRLGLTPRLVQLQQSAHRTRGYGDFWQHMLVAEGAVDIAVDAVGLAPYDNAAVQIVVDEAGGRHTDRFGRRDYRADTAVSTNGRLHHEVITILGA